MKRRLAVFVLPLALLVGGGAAIPATPVVGLDEASAKSCSAGYKHAVLPTGHKCLRRAQFCSQRYDTTYHRYGFHCHSGRLTGASSPRPPVKRKPKPRAQVIDARLTDVVDGDTVKVRAYGARRTHYTVRMIGIDTPETRKPGTPVECGGKDATSHLLRHSFTEPMDTDGDGLLDDEGGTGRRATLTTDPSQSTFDRYGRLLAYVSTRSGSLQVRQLRAGWANVYVYRGKRFRQFSRFDAARDAARAARRGVWGTCDGDFHTPAVPTTSQQFPSP